MSGQEREALAPKQLEEIAIGSGEARGYHEDLGFEAGYKAALAAREPLDPPYREIIAGLRTQLSEARTRESRALEREQAALAAREDKTVHYTLPNRKTACGLTDARDSRTNPLSPDVNCVACLQALLPHPFDTWHGGAAREEPLAEIDDREWHWYGEQAGRFRGETTWTGPALKQGERVTVVSKSRLAALEYERDAWARDCLRLRDSVDHVAAREEPQGYRAIARKALGILQRYEDPHEALAAAKTVLTNGLADLQLAAREDTERPDELPLPDGWRRVGCPVCGMVDKFPADRTEERGSREWRACARDGDGLPDYGEPVSTRGDAERNLADMLDAEPPYDHGWVEFRVVGPWTRLRGSQG
jgi:hypothetical protein